MTLYNDEVDVLILGSGCAALVAALHAAGAGLKVLVCEKTSKFGGTSAMSAGGIWIAANPLARKAGIDDDLDEAFAYMCAVAPEGWNFPQHWRALLDAGPRMLDLLQSRTPLRFKLTGEPDPYADAPGAKVKGRMLSVLPISRLAARGNAFRVRGSTLPEIFTYHELLETDLYHKPVSTTLRLLPRLAGRMISLSAGKGTALMIGLIRGCQDAGVRLQTRAAGTELIVVDGRVTGAVVNHCGKPQRIRARVATLIATGGFEWSADMMRRHFVSPVQFFGSPDGNTGDGQRMAQAAGAELAAMDQANVTAAIPRRYEGMVHGMPVPYHAEENAIVVNRHGQRFWDELHVNLGEALIERDPQTGEPLHLPAFVITDARYPKKAPLVRFFARLVPGWLVKAPTIPDLARKIGIDPDALNRTVERFNGFAATGVDEDFERGKTRAHQKADKRKRAGLEPIAKPPFIAIRFNPSIMSTKGGPRTDPQGRVLRPDGTVIEGLYAAGASMANPIGTRGVGAGTTLGPFMSWGYLCADDMIRQARKSGILPS
ncbi:FAD-dependent oxidoreductase [Mesorhizobium sp. 1B3]|uniref:FAD-dependent oxidoreductase n=1 Tax=Mesorhizobium sp. 1B3 TaxID=3243599 RepID=UPI003D973400